MLALSGCAGYRVGDISGRDLQGVRSVYVPTVRNTSLQPDLQMTVTNAIIRRFNDDGMLSVAQNAAADSELDVTVTNVYETAVRSSNSDILVTAEYQLTIEATATYVNRKLGRKIFENYAVSGSTRFFHAERHPEGIRQAARWRPRIWPITRLSWLRKAGRAGCAEAICQMARWEL